MTKLIRFAKRGEVYLQLTPQALKALGWDEGTDVGLHMPPTGGLLILKEEPREVVQAD